MLKSFAKRLLIIPALFPGLNACATVITVQPGDNYSKIEAANPGDTVLIAPGTYSFLVYLQKQASATNPITIAAQDPSHRPVWDFGTNLLDTAPGDYTAGDRGRGGWQLSGARNYNISGIVFRNCRNAAHNSAGIRYYNTTSNLYLKDCLFELNDDGLTGGTQNSQATVEFCEFNANGNTNASSSSPTHNIYVYGGYLTMRYCFVHDSVQGQNFHIRCVNSTFEYNWFSRAANYDGDLMTDDDFSGAGPFTQTMTLRGNVILQNSVPGNHSQVVAIYNDEGQTNLTMTVNAVYNTFIGYGGSSAFVHVSNATGTKMNAIISDNIISGTTVPYLIENTNKGTATGVNNWLPSGAVPGNLTGSVQSASPGFRNPSALDYRLAPGSPCIAAASASVNGPPGEEYFFNEATNRMWRIRAAAHDIGAFENSTSSNPVGPYSPPPLPQLTLTVGATAALLSWPLFGQSFSLQSTVALGSWTNFPAALTTNADGVSTPVSLTGGAAFFRLQP
jgi:hypothetical protein